MANRLVLVLLVIFASSTVVADEVQTKTDGSEQIQVQGHGQGQGRAQDQNAGPGLSPVTTETQSQTQPEAQRQNLQTEVPCATVKVSPGNELSIPPGIAYAERINFARKLKLAACHGIGVKPYEEAFKQLQESLAANPDEAAFRQRLASLDKAIDNQLISIKSLQEFHPTPGPSTTSLPNNSLVPGNLPANASVNGAVLFSQKCTGCHTMGGGGRRDLIGVATWDAGSLSNKVAQMQRFRAVGVLSPQEIAALVQYLQHH